MGNYEHDGNPEHDWDDGWDTAWSEFDWERYLRSEDEEIAKYQTLYSKLIRSENRLDEIALLMGWQHDSALQGEEEPEQESGDADPGMMPYTLHKHPLFVASKALHGWLLEQWMELVGRFPKQVSADRASALQNAYAQSDYYGLLAVTALDLDDFALAIAYFKRGMVSLNKAMSLLAEIEAIPNDPIQRYAQQSKIRLFDIREIWLRVSYDCRATIARGSDDD